MNYKRGFRRIGALEVIPRDFQPQTRTSNPSEVFPEDCGLHSGRNSMTLTSFRTKLRPLDSIPDGKRRESGWNSTSCTPFTTIHSEQGRTPVLTDRRGTLEGLHTS